MHHHGAALRSLTKDDALVDAILGDPRGAVLPGRWRAIADVAITLTVQPTAIVEAQVRALHAVGMTDAGVHDVVAITAYFNFVNRLAGGFHIPIEAPAR